ncbi:MAG: glutamate-1-semialdehyde 2,1-aminomutase [Planctomycetaceae bacterium]|jgi:glutamate-1-semialdehyde 2,1-aminomutase|nr:glutamate-1-semialdehyde 2,1-aminomutase [Planctomycetaceae bacterium]
MKIDLAKSQAAFERAKRLIPGGVNSPARAFGAVGGHPLFIDRAKGAYLFDLDGNRFIDYIGSWGPMILGHAHEQVIESIVDAAQRGTSYGAPTQNESRIAELILGAFPSMQRVRLVSSGTEATMSAIRVARGFTRRDRIVKFSGCYHGHVDSLLVSAGSAAATLGVPDSPGVTPGTSQDTIVLNYNDSQAVRETLDQLGQHIAAVILEPIVGNMGTVIPTPEFLKTLREETQRHGVVLIFDEVMTGFRVAYGGAQQIFGIEPDMTTLGKIVGGGLPLAAYGGRSEIMDQVMPAGKVYQAGTLSGNPLATAAGAKTLELLRDDPPYEYLESLGKRLGDGLLAAAKEHGVSAQLQRVGSMMTLFFNPDPVVDWPSADRSDRKLFAKYFWGLIERGVYMPCSQFEALFFSRAHSVEDIDRTIQAAVDFFSEHAHGR